jgi:HSP20 family molecular chaperone IbpA
MSSQTAPVKSQQDISKQDTPAAAKVNSAKHDLRELAQERIASRAYQLYEQNGCPHGADVEHWLQAESEILTRFDDIHESGSWYTFNAPLAGFSSDDIQVSVEPNYLLVAAVASTPTGGQDSAGEDSFRRILFASTKWPGEVDPSTASAYFKDGKLTIAVKRALPGA